MREWTIKAALGAALLCAVVAGLVRIAVAQPSTQSRLVELPAGKAAARSGACVFPSGGWAINNCSNGAASTSGALNAWSRYVVQCGVDTYIAFGASGMSDADSSDGYVPAESWLEFMTTPAVTRFSCLNIGSDSDCRYIECM